MEYVFGTVRRNASVVENLKTINDVHTELKGLQQVVREYADNVITDSFYVAEHYRSDEDEDGNCYDWYVIQYHNRYIDKFTPARPNLESDIAETQDALCEVSEDFDQRIADIEDALCDLSEMEV